jgi:hypothetical protein
MCLQIHSDASYLSEIKVKSRSSGFDFLSDSPKEPTSTSDPNATSPPENGTVHVHSTITKPVLSSTADAETGAVLFNCKEG